MAGRRAQPARPAAGSAGSSMTAARSRSLTATLAVMATLAALLALLVALPAAAAGKAGRPPLEACPPPCRCFLSEGLKRADCRHVPEWAEWADDGQPSDAQAVRVLPPPAGRGARSAALHLTHFEVFPKVLQLSVTNRSLVEVIPSGFHGLRSLQVLDLSHNLLSRFNPKVFLRMPALRRLVLAGNPVALEAGMPLLVSKSLLSLDLSHCDVAEVPRGSLDGLRNLTALSLRGNPLHLEAGRPLLRLATLAELDLSACELETLPAGVLAGLAGLRRLYLDGNGLHTVGARGVLPRGLHHLDLSGNQIRDAPTAVISSLRNLSKLELSDNPITCTCSLIGLQGWLSRSLVVTERPVVCADPAEYRGKSWTKVDELQLCSEEEKQSGNVSESSSRSSDESSSSSDEESAASNAAAPAEASLPDDLDDDSLELPPASYEVYTHENYLGGHPLPLKVKKLDSAPLAARGVSHNDISFFQADQPYDLTTARSQDESGEAASAASVASTATELSTEREENREPLSSDEEEVEDGKASVEEGGNDNDADDDGDGDGETEKDAETFMRNAKTIAMGKSMPGKEEEAAAKDTPASSAPADAQPTESASAATHSEGHADAGSMDSVADTSEQDSGATDAGMEDSLGDDVTTTASIEDADDHLSGEHHHDETSVEGSTEEDHMTTSAEGHDEGSTPDVADVTTVDPETTTTEQEEAAAAVPVVPVAAGGDRAEHGRALDGDVSSAEGGHHDEEHHDTGRPGGEATAVPDVVVSPGLPEQVDEEVAKEAEQAGSSPSPEEAPVDGGEGAAPAVGGEVAAAATTAAPEAALPAVEEEVVPAVATNIVGSEREGEPAEGAAEHRPEAEDGVSPTEGVAVVPPAHETAELEPEPAAKPEAEPEAAPEAQPEAEPEAKTEDAPEAVPPVQVAVEEAVPAPKVAAEAELVPVLAPGVSAPAAPDNEVEVVGGPAPDAAAADEKRNEGLAVERVPPGQGDAGDADAQLQKSTITYVILGCIVVTMVVLTLYALLRSKAKKQADTEKGLRIRRDNGDARGHHGLPEGTEMKDMMNPLLGAGQAQPELAERRGSLASLELIREVEEDPGETARLQPNGAGGPDRPDAGGADRPGAGNGVAAAPAVPAAPAKGASESKPPAKKTPDTAKRTTTHAASNGKATLAVTNGAASPATPATTPGSATPSTPRVAEQPSKVKVKAGVINTPVPRTPVLVNRVNNGAKANGNGLNRST